MRTILFCAGLVLTGCTTTQGSSANTHSGAADRSGTASSPVALAQHPFTAKEIRGATGEGREYRFRIDTPEGSTLRRSRFSDVTDAGATIETGAIDDAGNPLGTPRVSSTTWAALRAHADFPREATTIEDVTVDVPAGHFDAWLYTVRKSEDGVEVVSRFWFAKALPGAPVQAEITRGGTRVMRMTLVQHRPGK